MCFSFFLLLSEFLIWQIFCLCKEKIKKDKKNYKRKQKTISSRPVCQSFIEMKLAKDGTKKKEKCNKNHEIDQIVVKTAEYVCEYNDPNSCRRAACIGLICLLFLSRKIVTSLTLILLKFCFVPFCSFFFLPIFSQTESKC